MANLSRRDLLKGGATVAVGVSAFSFSSWFGYKRMFAQGDGDDPQTILNLATTAEALACTSYFTAINSADALGLTDEQTSQLRAFLDAEVKHKQFLEANGGQALTLDFYTPVGLFEDLDLFVSTTNTLENLFVAAYLAATRRFAELGNPLLAATTAQVMGTEAEHQALIRLMGGLQPSFQVLKEALFYNTSEVAPFAQPFLEGGDGFEGPASFPGDEAIAALVGDEGVVAGVPFINLTNQMGTVMMENSTEVTVEATQETGPCVVTGRNTNIRSGPSTSNNIVGTLAAGTTANVTGQSADVNGAVWYQIDQGWVRSDVVIVSGDCSSVQQLVG